MPAIRTTAFEGRVTWLGQVPPDISDTSIRSAARDRLDLDFGGAVGAHHYGLTRSSCVRVSMLYPEGTEIGNTRQVSILAQEDIDAIASAIGLERLNPALLGASIVLSGIPDFSHVPPSSRLQAGSGLTFTVDMENRPCALPGREIEADHPGHGKAFRAAAKGRRGVTAWVERPGSLAPGDTVRLFVPDQPAWSAGG